MESSQFDPAPSATALEPSDSFQLQALLPPAPKSTPSTPPVSPKVSKIPLSAPQTKLTGEAALASRQESRRMEQELAKKGLEPRTSPNPASILTGFNISRSGDAPATSPTSQKVLGSIASAANAMDTSGAANNTSLALHSESQGEAGAAPAGNTTDPSLLQPHTVNHETAQYQSIAQQRSGSISEALSATTPTTPGFSATTPTTPFSPSATTPGGSRAKHTCPHCSQTFTRHHNLKSHLLTHSHEKPFVCQTCQARFRRLHDLKRHSKLHTGERPHMCHKCGRKFARGDALARHARAEGGCAGRRSSMGVGEDGSMSLGPHDEEMDGLDSLIDGDQDGDIDMGGTVDPPASSRRRSLPSIRTDFSTTAGVGGVQTITPASGYTPNPHHSHTYPPTRTTPASLKPQPPPPQPTPVSAIMLSPHNNTLTTSPRPVSPGFQAPAANMGGVGGVGGTAVVGNNVFAGFDGIWGYVRGLESRVKNLEETVVGLRARLEERGEGGKEGE